MVKSGLEKCIDTHDSDLAATEKKCLYDSEDYAAAYLQVLNLNDIIPDPSRDLHSVICRKGDVHKLFENLLSYFSHSKCGIYLST